VPLALLAPSLFPASKLLLLLPPPTHPFLHAAAQASGPSPPRPAAAAVRLLDVWALLLLLLMIVLLLLPCSVAANRHIHDTPLIIPSHQHIAVLRHFCHFRHLVVTNPHIKRVYTSYYHAFETLRIQPLVRTLEDNERFCILLRRLVDEHGVLCGARTLRARV
jgi:Mitochondrial branched-chain alpha-ketoacid dehydrogenase kinase